MEMMMIYDKQKINTKKWKSKSETSVNSSDQSRAHVDKFQISLIKQ
jgi:hypothetical protein